MMGRGITAGDLTVFSDETEEERADRLGHERRRIAAALRSVDEGRVIPFGDMAEWAASLGTEQPLPLPRARRWGDRITVSGVSILADEAAETLGYIEWWYSQPGVGAAVTAIRKVRALLAAIDRLATTPECGLPGETPGTRELTCQNHRIVYLIMEREKTAERVGDAVVFDIFGPAHPDRG